MYFSFWYNCVPSELGASLRWRIYQLFSHSCLQTPTLIYWLNMPQSVVSPYSVDWFGAGQESSAGLTRDLLCSSLGGLGKLGLCLPRSFILRIKGKAYNDYGQQGLEVTHHHFHHHITLLKGRAGASPDSRGGETDFNSWRKKQEIIVTSFTPPLRATLLKLHYWTEGTFLTSLSKFPVTFCPEARSEKQKPLSPPPIQCSCQCMK